MANAFALNYGRGSETQFGDYNDIMNAYRGIAGMGGEGGGGGGVSDGGFNAMGMYSPFTVNYSDPFKSYGGFEEFSTTGGYSRNDIANMRARGASPVRAAYANAEREVGRQRSLQGGYSPNAVATMAKMAREQGQASADAMQNVEAGLAEARNKGRLAGLTGMSGIEGQRLDAQLKAGMFNADAQARAQAQNIQAGENAAGRSSAASAQSSANQLAALSGMRQMYGTTPGMTEVFGNQLLNAVGQGGTMGVNRQLADIQGQQLPGAYEQTKGRINDISNMAYPWLDYIGSRMGNKQQSPYPGTPITRLPAPPPRTTNTPGRTSFYPGAGGYQ
jgi:hypothetical protein